MLAKQTQSIGQYCAFALISFAFDLLVWKIAFKKLFSAYIFVFVATAIFCLGQPFAWGMGWMEGERNLFDPTNDKLIYSIAYSTSAINIMHLGAFLVCFPLMCHDNVGLLQRGSSCSLTNNRDIAAFKKVGLILLTISLLPFLYYSFVKIYTSYIGGYLSYDEFTSNSSMFETTIYYLSNLFIPSLLILYAVELSKGKRGFLFVVLIIISVIPSLYSGGRSPVAMTLISLVYVHYVFKKKKSNILKVLILTVLAYIIVISFSVVLEVRYLDSKGFSTYFTVFLDNLWTGPQKLLYELGWSLSSLFYTKQIVPSAEPYRNGLSYLWGLLNVVPNFGQWGNNVSQYSALSQWLTDFRNTGSGTGYTLIAESYINFGSYGLFVMLFWGLIFGYFLHYLPLKSDKKTKANIMVAMFLALILKPIVRSDLSNAIRLFAYNFILIYLIYYFVKGKTNEYR